LTVLRIRFVHGCQVNDKISDLPIKLILVDVPFRATAAGNVHVVINQRDSGEILCAFDGGLVVRVADELGVIISTLSS
jgi:hypothetical protein